MRSSLIRLSLAILLLLTTISSNSNRVIANSENNNKDDKEKEEKVHISPKCAAVLLTSGTVIGGTITALALPSLGFTSIGVAKGSIVACWQSTMPLVQAGSLFASLQSIAMTGGVGSSVIVTGSLGGAAAASKLKQFCAMIDDINPDSKEAIVIDTMVIAQQKFGNTWSDIVNSKDTFTNAWDSIKDQVSTMELDPEGKIYNAWTHMKDQVSNLELDPNGNIQKLWNDVKEKVYNKEIDPSGQIGEAWNDIKDQASTIQLDPKGNIERTWNRVKEHASNVEFDSQGKMGKLWKEMKDQALSAKNNAEQAIDSFMKNFRQ